MGPPALQAGQPSVLPYLTKRAKVTLYLPLRFLPDGADSLAATTGASGEPLLSGKGSAGAASSGFGTLTSTGAPSAASRCGSQGTGGELPAADELEPGISASAELGP